MEVAVGIAGDGADDVGGFVFGEDIGVGDGAVLRIVHDAGDCAGAGGLRDGSDGCEEKRAEWGGTEAGEKRGLHAVVSYSSG
jgi:hypothetical protein